MPSSTLQGILDNQKVKDNESFEQEDSMEDQSLSSKEKRLLYNARINHIKKKEIDSIIIHSFSFKEQYESSNDLSSRGLISNQCISNAEEEFTKGTHTQKLNYIDPKVVQTDDNF